MHGNGSPYRGMDRVVENPLRRYVSGPVSTITPIAPRCFSSRPAPYLSASISRLTYIQDSKRGSTTKDHIYIPSNSSSDPVAAARSGTVLGLSFCAKIVNTPRSKHVSIAANAVG